MIHPKHLRMLIIRPVLLHMGMDSVAAVNLLMGTAAQESHMGRYLMQVDSKGNPVGPALGIFQMESETHNDLWNTYILRPEKRELRQSITDRFGEEYPARRLVYDLEYATAMARIKYWRDSEPLPDADDIYGLGRYWKRVYNTPAGKGRVVEFIENYNRYVLETD